jgi:hypothetical protein
MMPSARRASARPAPRSGEIILAMGGETILKQSTWMSVYTHTPQFRRIACSPSTRPARATPAQAAVQADVVL